MSSFWLELERRLSSVCPDPRQELSVLAESVLDLEPSRFRLLRLTGDLLEPGKEDSDRLCRLVARRCQGEPLQYLTGTADFYGRRFSVRPGVLIPRFDTEILIDTALPMLKEGDRILDLCAGTGCIGLTLGAEKNVSVTEVEKFDEAFSLLEENASALCPSARLVQADVLVQRVEGEYDMIVSNPPYIPTADLPILSPEVQKEPVTALDGGADGLLFYREILRLYSDSLKLGGSVLFECGIGQAGALDALLVSFGYREVFRVRDYGGVERVVGAKK